MLESAYQAKLIKKIERLLPGCVVLKLDANYRQGIPDLLVLYGTAWGTLETKRSEKERNNPEPNQEYYVDYLDNMSFSAFIYPEIEKEVLLDLQQTLQS